MSFTRIKFCGFSGIKGIYDAFDQCIACGVETDICTDKCWRLSYFGLNLIERSKRYIEPELAVEAALTMLESDMMQSCDPVILFADHSHDHIVDSLRDLIDLGEEASWVLQLHGDETPEFVKALPDCFEIIKAIPFDPKAIDTWRGNERLYGLMIDAPKREGELSGGTGRTFDWQALADLDKSGLPEKLFLAGGLTPHNVGQAIHIVRPYAVDVAGGIESSPSIKDGELMQAFCEAVVEADEALS